MSTVDTGDLEERIIAVIAREGMIPREKINRDSTLEDLEIQSIDMVMILQGIEEEFGIYVPMDEKMMELKNVGQVIDTISGLVQAKNAASA
ncbi:MAG: phosphopantetheine-binding protein [Hyphomicrobiales bacterium]